MAGLVSKLNGAVVALTPQIVERYILVCWIGVIVGAVLGGLAIAAGVVLVWALRRSWIRSGDSDLFELVAFIAGAVAVIAAPIAIAVLACSVLGLMYPEVGALRNLLGGR
jgi:hypothetical protein